MKQTISLAIVMMLAISSVFAKDKERVSKHETIKGANISITYGRPSKKGRVIFGSEQEKPLEPYGKVWRTGADEATEITLAKDCLIMNIPVKAGTYTLFTIPEPAEWPLILNKKLGQWGAFDYEKYKDQNVFQSAGTVKHLDKPVETLTFTIQKDGLLMEWDKVSVFYPIKFYGE